MSINDGPPLHCDAPMQKLMPRRVAVHMGGMQATTDEIDWYASATAEHQKSITHAIDTKDPYAMPVQSNWSKDYADCSASERDDRWRDTHDAFVSWQTRCLERDGVSRESAESQAKETQTRVIEESRKSNERLDGLT